MTQEFVDLFAGPGGWEQGLRDAGFDGTGVGLEWDESACRTAEAAGHLRVQADVATYPTDPFVGYDGLILSPPCPEFSRAFNDRKGIESERGALVWQVMRWADAIRPRWIACEQVPDVLPIWGHFAALLRERGYSTWAGVLNSADYGVPQTRSRAILMASLDGPVTPPAPTHAKDPAPSLFGPELRPWVSVADALGQVNPVGPVDLDALMWTTTRPATTIVSSFCPDVVAAPGYRGLGGPSRQNAPGSIRVTVEEAGVLQSFPRDYPWQGSKTKKRQQIGNAIPPKLAGAVVGQLVGAAVPA